MDRGDQYLFLIPQSGSLQQPPLDVLKIYSKRVKILFLSLGILNHGLHGGTVTRGRPTERLGFFAFLQFSPR